MAGEKLGGYVGDKIFDYVESGGQPKEVSKQGEGGAPGVSISGEVDLSGTSETTTPKASPVAAPASSKLNQVTSKKQHLIPNQKNSSLSSIMD